MGHYNFPPARVFETFTKENTERPRGIRSFFNAASTSGDYTTIMLVGMRSRIDPAGNGEDALDIIHRAFDPCEELPGIDMDPFFDYTLAPAHLYSDGESASQLVFPKLFFNSIEVPEQKLRLLIVTGPSPTLHLKKFTDKFFRYVLKQGIQHAVFVETHEAQVPHTRRYPLALTSYDEQLTAVPGIGVEMHTGPVSPTTILANQAQQAGLGRSLTLRVGIPGYLSAEAQNPRAVVDMIKALEKILGITVDSEEYTELQAKADSWEQELADEMADDFEKVEIVREYEQRVDESLQSVSGEELANDIEEFLGTLTEDTSGGADGHSQ